MQSLVAGYFSRDVGNVKVHPDGTLEIEYEGRKFRTKVHRWLDAVFEVKQQRAKEKSE